MTTQVIVIKGYFKEVRDENICKMAKHFDIERSTVHNIMKKRSKIIELVKTMESGPGKRNTRTKIRLLSALITYFLQERSKHIPISNDISRMKAKEFYQKITGLEGFRTDVWLDANNIWWKALHW